jgi:hypothetical protein
MSHVFIYYLFTVLFYLHRRGLSQACIQQEAVGYLLVSLFDPEDGGSMFLQNFGEDSALYLI